MKRDNAGKFTQAWYGEPGRAVELFLNGTAWQSLEAVSSAIEALQALPQHQPDVLLLDIGMPQMDGYTLLGGIRTLEGERDDRPIPTIALTTCAGDMNQQRAQLLDVKGILPNPLNRRSWCNLSRNS